MRPKQGVKDGVLTLTYSDDDEFWIYKPKLVNNHLSDVVFSEPMRLFGMGGDDNFSISPRFFQRVLGVDDQGGEHPVYLYGGEGDDTLNASHGAVLFGGVGDDAMSSRIPGGKATFVGGTGDDFFVALPNAKVIVRDFEPGADTFRIFGQAPIEIANEEEEAELLELFDQKGRSAVLRHDFEGDGKVTRIVLRNTDVDDLVTDDFEFWL